MGLVFLGETGGWTRQSRFLPRAREGGGGQNVLMIPIDRTP